MRLTKNDGFGCGNRKNRFGFPRGVICLPGIPILIGGCEDGTATRSILEAGVRLAHSGSQHLITLLSWPGPRRGEIFPFTTGEYHIEGDLVLASKERLYMYFKNCMDIFKLLERFTVFFLSPMPRYLYKACCTREDHAPNTREDGFEDTA